MAAEVDLAKANGNAAQEVLHAGPMVMRDARRISKLQRGGRVGGDVEGEIGTTGLRQFGGYVLEEWLQQLQGRRAAWAYREMMDNDPVVGSILFAIEMLARGVVYSVEGAEGDDAERSEFIESCMHDMSHTWLDFISEALTMLPYGWSFQELVYKTRNGPMPDPIDPGYNSLPLQDQPPRGAYTGQTGYNQPMMSTGRIAETEEDSNYEPASSEFKDGKIGWRKIPTRAQETLLRWHFNGYSGLRAMEQIDWHGGYHVIPIDKAVLFRTKTTRNNPEGRSILRNAWTSFYRMSNIQQIEAIGIERDLAGIPVVTPPEGVDLNSQAMQEVRKVAEEMVTSIRRDEDEGILFPAAGWELKLVSTGGARQIDTSEVIRRYEQRIASSVLADFVLLGQDAVGSYAMVDIKSELFGIAVDTVLDIICETMNKYAIPRLLKMNGMRVDKPPRIVHSSAGRLNLEVIGRFLQSVALAGGPIPWSKELIEELLKEARLPAVWDGSLQTPGNPEGPIHRVGVESENGRPEGKQNDARERAMATKKADSGPIIGMAGVLGERAGLLSAQLEAEIDGALHDLGEEAATALLHEAQKRDKPSRRQINAVIKRVMDRINVKGWVEGRLMPILRNHAGRTALDAQRVTQKELGIELHLAEENMLEMMHEAGSQLQVADIEPQVRSAIARAIEEGAQAGDSPLLTANRIRASVPQGRFTRAGTKYRSQLIARNETANLQRKATLGLYESNPRVVAVKLRDGIYGPPRSDEACIERDGEEVPIGDARKVVPYHPLCTLGFDPVISAHPSPGT